MFSDKHCFLSDKISLILGKRFAVDASVRGKHISRAGTILPYMCLFNISPTSTDLSRYANVERYLNETNRLFIKTFQSSLLLKKKNPNPNFSSINFLLLIRFQLSLDKRYFLTKVNASSKRVEIEFKCHGPDGDAQILFLKISLNRLTFQRRQKINLPVFRQS